MWLQSQTSLKDLEKETTCPFRWKSQWLDKKFSMEPNEYMLRGLFFESLAIGGGAKEQLVLDLPRLRNGNKSTNHLRIEEQANNFAQLFNPSHERFLGFEITETQIYIEHDGRCGTLDFIARDADGNPCLFDLKLTTNLSRGWWSDIAAVDMLQQYHYHSLYLATREVPEGKTLRNLLAIFDYTPKKSVLITEINPTQELLDNTNERFIAGKEVVKLYEENGWSYLPSNEECAGCPLKCKHRYGD